MTVPSDGAAPSNSVNLIHKPGFGGVLVEAPIAISLHDPDGDAVEAMVTCLIHVGSQVRVELERAGGGEVRVELTLSEADELELDHGDIVYVRHSPTMVLSV